jgi:hypothetical protein
MPAAVWAAGGLLLAGGIAYGGYKVYKYVTAVKTVEAAKEEGLMNADAGADAGAPTE